METNGAILIRTSRVFQGMFEGKKNMDEHISARLKYHMQRAKISQSKLAAAVGCSKDVVFSYVNGKIPEEHMNIAVLKKMAVYFGMEEHYFCNDYHVFLDTTDVPEFLKKLRKKNGLSQREFTATLGIPRSVYQKYEMGRVRLPERYWRVLIKT